LINAISGRTSTGAGRGQRSVKKARKVGEELGFLVATEGASPAVCQALSIPIEWAERCEDTWHVGHDGTKDALSLRLDQLLKSGHFANYADKIMQLGSYGGGNHFACRELLPDSHGGFAGEGRVHRKGATRAFPAGHPALKDTPFAATGHPILLPGNPTAGSCIMVADPGAEKSCYSVNHGAGRAKGRKPAIRELDQKTVDDEFTARDILTN
jgi:RNA-splicing ligase RtcB